MYCDFLPWRASINYMNLLLDFSLTGLFLLLSTFNLDSLLCRQSHPDIESEKLLWLLKSKMFILSAFLSKPELCNLLASPP
jgi:hypothetical protein